MEHARGDEPSRDNAREKSAHRGVGDREGQVRTRLGTACRVVLPSLLLVIALRVLLVGVYVIPTGSIVPTIMPGDFIPGEKA
jgi:signal peptidase I